MQGADTSLIDTIHDGEVKLYGSTKGALFENERFRYGARAGLIDMDPMWAEHRDMTIRNCHFQGLQSNENWGVRLRRITGMFTVENVLSDGPLHEHCFYTDIHGSARIRNVHCRNAGSQAWQNRPTSGTPVGEGHTILVEDFISENCGLPTGRRPGFALTFNVGARQDLEFNRVRIINKDQTAAWVPKGANKPRYNSTGGLLVREHAGVEIKRLLIDMLNPGQPAIQFDDVPFVHIRGGHCEAGKITIFGTRGEVHIRRMSGNLEIVHKADPQDSAVIARIKAEGGFNKGYTYIP